MDSGNFNIAWWEGDCYGDGKKRKHAPVPRCQGPGPACYCLPSTVGFINHDITKDKAPAFFHAGKPGNIWDDLKNKGSPGPVHALDPKVTHLGREEAPSYALRGRPKDLSACEKKPGPANYNPENCNLHKAQSFSLKGRMKWKNGKDGPAPNSYNLPAIIGGKKSGALGPSGYTIQSRKKACSFHEDLFQSPGPANYHSIDMDLTKKAVAKYSVGKDSRWHKSTIACNPGPGQHDLPKLSVHKQSVPKHSLGQRHSQYVMPTNWL